mmetsp:Transcript_7457/g.18277  ORF Transcript_7457/g.18277 Transcript_7457/m.18277 type:complete len:160 (-) Transcript_7457:77-556(-)
MNFSSKKSDYGDSGLGLMGDFPDTIKIEHVFTLQIPGKWDRPIRRWVDKCLDLTKQYAESFHFIAVGIGSYFFLLGISKIVAASKSSRSSSTQDSNEGSSTTKKKSSRIKNPKRQDSGNEPSAKTAKTTDVSISPQKTSSTKSKATVVQLPATDSKEEA